MLTYTLSCHKHLKTSTGIAFKQITLSGEEHHPLHNHTFCELIVVEKGQLLHFFNGRDYYLNPHSLALVMPQDTHMCKAPRSENKTAFVNVAFETSLFEEVLQFASSSWKISDFNNGLMIPDIDHESWELILRKVLQVSDSTNFDETSQLIAFKSLLLDVIVLLLQPMNRLDSRIPAWLQTACREMRKKENYTVGMHRFVELTGKTQEHLTRSMRKYLELTPNVYINSLRLRYVANLLVNTDQNILDIFLDAGFNSPSNAIRQFKRTYGLAPGQYRKANTASTVKPLRSH